MYFWSQNGVPEVREVVKKLPRGRRIRSVRVSAQTEPRRPNSDPGILVFFLMLDFRCLSFKMDPR